MNGTHWLTRRQILAVADRPDRHGASDLTVASAPSDASVASAQRARPLLSSSARPWARALLASSAVVVAVLGAVFAHQTTADGFDRAVDTPVITWFAGHHTLALWLAAPGSLAPAAGLTAAIVIACLFARRLNGAVLALMAVPVAEAICEGLLKPLIHRTYLGGVVYPSGHTTAICALAATVFVLLVASPQPVRTGVLRWLRLLVLAAACVLCAGVAFGLIGLKWHYFTDIVAGAAVGIGTVCGLSLILDLPAVRRLLARVSRRRGPAGDLAE